jgi:hypothetical protein
VERELGRRLLAKSAYVRNESARRLRKWINGNKNAFVSRCL